MASSPAGNWVQDYPVTFAAPAAAVAGGALGALYHIIRKNVNKDYDGSLLLNTALGMGAGAVAGGAYALAKSPDGVAAKVEGELEELKYDRNGMFRQALRAIRPMIPTRDSNHAYPETFTKYVKEPLTDLPKTVAYGGNVAPNHTVIAVGSPPGKTDGLWREGFEGGKPKKFFTLDKFLEGSFGKPKDSASYTGSEVLGSSSQLDYNDANERVFSTAHHMPLTAADRVLTVTGHGSGKDLSSVAGVRYVDILKQLLEKGTIKNVNHVVLQTCNTGSCNIPKDVIQAALGKNSPSRMTYTPPTATGRGDVLDAHLQFVNKNIPGRGRLSDPNLFTPKRITTALTASQPDRKAVPVFGDEASASQTLVNPLIPVDVTERAADSLGKMTAPIMRYFADKPDILGRILRGTTKMKDYGHLAAVYDPMSTVDMGASDIVARMQRVHPEWFTR